MKDELKVIEYRNIRVLTTQQLAEAYETDSKIVSNNFNRNKERYIEGKHYICLEGENKRNFLNNHQIDDGLKNASKLYLWTEKGAFLHAKSLNTDKAWEVYDHLVDTYFQMKEEKKLSIDEIINNPDFGIQLLSTLKEEKEKRKALEIEVKIKDQIIGELKPKADYTSMILNNKGLVTITQIAKDYGMSGQEMNKILHNLGVQYKQSEQWLLYKTYQDKGYTHSTTVDIKHKDGTPDIRMNTKWTQKGRLFLYELLKKNGYLPVIEQQQTA